MNIAAAKTYTMPCGALPDFVSILVDSALNTMKYVHFTVGRKTPQYFYSETYGSVDVTLNRYTHTK